MTWDQDVLLHMFPGYGQWVWTRNKSAIKIERIKPRQCIKTGLVRRGATDSLHRGWLGVLLQLLHNLYPRRVTEMRIRPETTEWEWKNTPCRPIMGWWRLQHANGFSNALILVPVRTDCTKPIYRRGKLADQFARGKWLPERKIGFRTSYCNLSEPALRSGVNKTAAANVREPNRNCIHLTLIQPLFLLWLTFVQDIMSSSAGDSCNWLM